MKNRFEEYLSFEDNIPFVLNRNLKRTGKIRSGEANFHENIELQFCLDGEGIVRIGGEDVTFEPGEIIGVSSSLIHHTGSEGYLEYSCIIIDSAFFRDAGIDPESICLERKFRDDDILSVMDKIYRAYDGKGDSFRSARLRQLTLELILLLCERHLTEEPRKNVEKSFENAKKAINFIKSRFYEKISLDDMSKALYVNKFVLSRQFKAEVGVSIFEYLNSFRCEYASRLISEGKNVKEAARECGFENMSYFSRTFRHYMGKLPSECKKAL